MVACQPTHLHTRTQGSSHSSAVFSQTGLGLSCSKGIEIAGKTLGVLGVVIDLGMQAKDAIDQAKIEKERRENRDAIRSSFNGMADALESHYSAELRKLLQENEAFQPRIEAINQQLESIDQLEAEKSATTKRLLDAVEACNCLIRDVHEYLAV